MPIIDNLSDINAPLTQGDILKGVTLHSTKWDATGGVSVKADRVPYCMVLSRPCNAFRDAWIIVAAIEKYKGTVPNPPKTLDEIRKFYTTIRDGLVTPDLLYLGQFNGVEGCFCVRFDSLHTVQIPKADVERKTFIQSCRFAKLNPDFVHDLHVRLTRAFASLGFDDYRWFSTADLEGIEAVAKKIEAAKNAEIADFESKVTIAKGQGVVTEQTKAAEKKLAELKDELTDLKKESLPFTEELAVRRTPK